MTAFTKILMATDFGTESDAALLSCASLARGLGASIHLLHVIRDPIVAVSTPELYGIDWVKLREDMILEARQKLATLASSVPDVAVMFEAVVGQPAESIAQRALDIGANLIVVGTHGRSGMGHLLIGSVAERVIRLAPCPVMAVRGSGAVRVRTGELAAAARQSEANVVA